MKSCLIYTDYNFFLIHGVLVDCPLHPPSRPLYKFDIYIHIELHVPPSGKVTHLIFSYIMLHFFHFISHVIFRLYNTTFTSVNIIMIRLFIPDLQAKIT